VRRVNFLGFQFFVNKKLVIYLLSKEEELWFLRMHFSSPIVRGLAQMAIVAPTQYQERRNNGNVV
jgi:hypothetical protein